MLKELILKMQTWISKSPLWGSAELSRGQVKERNAMPSSMLGPPRTSCWGLLQVGSSPYLLAQTDITAHYTVLSRVRAHWLSLELALKGSFTSFPLQNRVLFSPSDLPSLTSLSTFSPSQMVSLCSCLHSCTALIWPWDVSIKDSHIHCLKQHCIFVLCILNKTIHLIPISDHRKSLMELQTEKAFLFIFKSQCYAENWL